MGTTQTPLELQTVRWRIYRSAEGRRVLPVANPSSLPRTLWRGQAHFKSTLVGHTCLCLRRQLSATGEMRVALHVGTTSRSVEAMMPLQAVLPFPAARRHRMACRRLAK